MQNEYISKNNISGVHTGDSSGKRNRAATTEQGSLTKEAIISYMEECEQSRMFEELFDPDIPVDKKEGLNKDALLQTVDPSMKLSKSFFLKVYGYELSYPGYADQMIQELEKAGCTKARDYYRNIVDESRKKEEESLKNVAKGMRKEIQRVVR